MSKISKKIIFIILLVISLILFPSRVQALTTEYKNINEEILSLDDNNSNFQFTKISFRNWSDSTNPTFGLTGIAYNGNDYDVSFLVTATYYDSNFNVVAKTYDEQFIPAGEYNSYSHISNLDAINSGYTVNDIVYYRIDADINKSGTTNNSGIINNSSDNNISTPSSSSIYSSYEYVIDNYNIDIVVNENNTFDITETITAYFNVPKHGIYRKIPLKNNITRLDGTTSKNRTQISNLSVNNEYTTSRQNGYYQIKIGSVNTTLTGKQTYTIKYTYNIGKDPIKDYDELYYNLIGNEWDTVIGNITFSITMPKDFDSKKLGFSSGILGSTNNSNLEYTVNDNKISGNYNGILGVGEALTVRCELPEGYFVGAGLTVNIMDYIMFLIPLLFLGIAIFLWHKFGRDEQVIETVEFYPPTGFNSLELGFLYKGKADNQDVISLLIYLANKGYIKISETEEKSLFSKSKGFKITKIKDYDGNNINEQIFLNGLFTKESSFTSSFSKDSETVADNVNEVTPIDLYNNFYSTIDMILSNINNEENKNKIFEKSASSKTIFIILMIIVTYCLITIPPIITYRGPSTLILALFFPGIGFTFMFNMLFGETQTIYVNGRATHSSVGTKIFGIVWGLMFGGISWALIVLPTLQQDPIYMIRYIIGLGSILGMIVCLKYLPKRTPYGTEILGKLQGFKNFLETAEKDKLEAMVMQDPTYFYNILPYTYVLGISDKWIKKFETISLQAPSWYDSPTAFDMVVFGTFMNSTMMSAQSVMSSSPFSSSGDSSGGGSSGGGSGGGGGGSW